MNSSDGPLFATAEEVARRAVKNDVHILGVAWRRAPHRGVRIEGCARSGARAHHELLGGVVRSRLTTS
ncbi:hypothetical protein [Bradyrhizobium sp. 23AC]